MKHLLIFIGIIAIVYTGDYLLEQAFHVKDVNIFRGIALGFFAMNWVIRNYE